MTGRNGTYEYCFSDGSEQFTVCRCEVFLEREELPLKYLCLLMGAQKQIHYITVAHKNMNIHLLGKWCGYLGFNKGHRND